MLPPVGIFGAIDANRWGRDRQMASENVMLSLMAVSALVPAAFIGFRKAPAKDAVFWLFLAVAFVGPFLWIVTAMTAAWRTDVSAALWITVAATLAAYAIIATFDEDAWRLSPLIWPLTLVLGLFAAIWTQQVSSKPMAETLVGWVGLHIAVSVATYALVTIAAVAALAGVLQERALKSKRPTDLTRMLPSITACDALMFRLMAIGEAVLALGLIIGMALNYGDTGTLASLDHKTVLAFGAFTLIGVLLAAHHLFGLRGRKAARWALSAYLFLTLGYPGVKFVTDVVLG